VAMFSLRGKMITQRLVRGENLVDNLKKGGVGSLVSNDDIGVWRYVPKTKVRKSTPKKKPRKAYLWKKKSCRSIMIRLDLAKGTKMDP